MEQVQKHVPKQRRPEEVIDPPPESIYDQELDFLTELVLRNIDLELEGGAES